MAEKRMFSKQIIDSDAFLDMPLSAQCLYFHLAMRADDDGFLNNCKKIQRVIGASEDDLRILFGKKFLIAFDDGIVVIKHWRIHNYIAKDRYKETVFEKEKAMLEVKENRAYSIKEQPDIQLVDALYTECIQDDDSLHPQIKNKDIEEDKDIDINIYSRAEPDNPPPKKAERHQKEIEEIIGYLNQKTGKAFKVSAMQNRRPIHARLDEGYTLDDFRKVIDTKAAEWLNTEFDAYLRPPTLFSTKFEGYLMQNPAKKKRPIVHDFDQRDYDGEAEKKAMIEKFKKMAMEKGGG